MKKLTRKQLKAVESLKYNLDELRNKPRRLFNSLRDFASAFCEDEELRMILADIHLWEDSYYANIRRADILEAVGQAVTSTRKEMIEEHFKYSKKGYEDYSDFDINKATKIMAKKITEEIIDEVY